MKQVNDVIEWLQGFVSSRYFAVTFIAAVIMFFRIDNRFARAFLKMVLPKIEEYSRKDGITGKFWRVLAKGLQKVFSAKNWNPVVQELGLYGLSLKSENTAAGRRKIAWTK